MKEKLNLMKLSEDEMKAIEGASRPVCVCGCWCIYAGTPGGSSPIDNSGANGANDRG